MTWPHHYPPVGRSAMLQVDHDAMARRHGAPEPKSPTDSFMLFHTGIEPGETIHLDARKMEDWAFGPHFSPRYFVYVGSPNLWLLKTSTSNNSPLTGSDVPCETYRPGCPTWVNWPLFSCGGFGAMMIMDIENRGKEKGDFIARMAGEFAPSPYDSPYPNPTGGHP